MIRLVNRDKHSANNVDHRDRLQFRGTQQCYVVYNGTINHSY